MRVLTSVSAVMFLAFHALAARADDGAALFGANCAMCHQAGGTGIPGAFPRLAGRVGPIASHADGRVYLIHVLSDGLSGSIQVDGAAIAGMMPALPQLSPAQVADVLTYVAGLGGGKAAPFTAAEIELARKSSPAPEAVAAERARLVASGVIPAGGSGSGQK